MRCAATSDRRRGYPERDSMGLYYYAKVLLEGDGGWVRREIEPAFLSVSALRI